MLVLKHIFFPITQLVIGMFWKQNPHFNFFLMGLIEKKRLISGYSGEGLEEAAEV